MLIIVFFFYSPVWGKKTSMSDEVKVDAKEENGSTETESKPKVVDDEKQDLGPPNALEQKIIRQIEVINFVGFFCIWIYNAHVTLYALSTVPKEQKKNQIANSVYDQSMILFSITK